MRLSSRTTILTCALAGLAATGWGAAAKDDGVTEALARRHATHGTSESAAADAASEASGATRAAIARRHIVTVSAVARRGLRGTSTARDVWPGLLSGNHRFVLGQPAAHELVTRRRMLAQGPQHPQAVVLGCADSRVSPELLFDQSLGELFVVRTAGNVADTIALASLEYAVEHLHVKALIVLGHEKCGAVAAAAGDEPMPSPSLEALVEKIRPALAPLRAAGAGGDLARRGVEANVRRSTEQILSESPLIAREVAAGRLALVKAIYHMETGEVVALP